MSLLTEYPAWFLLLCILAGAAFSFGLYYRRRKDHEGVLLISFLAFLRFLSVSLIAFLLLSPFVKRTVRIIEKPLIVVGIDGSLSAASSTDSLEVKNNLIHALKNLGQKLSRNCEVEFFTLGPSVERGLPSGFTGRKTDLSMFFNDISARYGNRNLGGIVIATDGLYNKGSNPVYQAQKMGIPVYTVALGDTSLHKDVFISGINVNRQVYINDVFPMEISVGMNQFPGAEMKLTVAHKGSTVFSRQLRSAGSKDFQRVNCTFQLHEKGIQKYVVEISSPGGEINASNNRREVYVEVLESRIRVAVVYDNPHPDIAAIISALSSSPKYEPTQLKTTELLSGSKEFDLYVLYQLPSVTGTADLSRLIPPGSPQLFILGSQTDISGFNRLKTGLTINAQRKSSSEIQPILNQDFALFGIPKEWAGFFSEFPPLQSPGGTLETSLLADVLLFQKIGSVSTRYPLFMFFDLPDKKNAVIAGENIWRWRMANFIKTSDFRMFDDMICLAVQYLSLRKDPSPFRVQTKTRIEEGDAMEFYAWLYNPGNEPINAPEVSLELVNEDGKKFNYVFTRVDKSYYLNAGYFQAGSYTWEAKVKSPQGLLKKQGVLSVIPLDAELSNLIADHALLQQLSAQSGGRMVYQAGIPGLESVIMERSDLKPLVHQQRKYTELAGEWWMFALIILLLSVEWAIRKQRGI